MSNKRSEKPGSYNELAQNSYVAGDGEAPSVRAKENNGSQSRSNKIYSAQMLGDAKNSKARSGKGSVRGSAELNNQTAALGQSNSIQTLDNLVQQDDEKAGIGSPPRGRGQSQKLKQVLNVSPLVQQRKVAEKPLDLSEAHKEVAFRQNRLDRRETTLDEEHKYYAADYQNGQWRTAAENKELYMQNYGIKFEIPSAHVQAAAIYPQDPSYSLQLVNYCMPREGDYQFIHHNLDGKSIQNSQEAEHTERTNGLVLRLLKRDEYNVKMIDEVILNTQKGLVKFSADGSLFAYFLFQSQSIRLLQVNGGNVAGLITNIKKARKSDVGFKIKYDGAFGGQNDLTFLKEIKFDQNKRFLVGYGDLQVFILNLQTGQGHTYDVEERKYDRILDVNLKSSDYDDYQCYIACRVHNMRRVEIFDLMEEVNDPSQRPQSLRGLHFFDEPAPSLAAGISDDFKQIVLANGTENLILEEDDGVISQRDLAMCKDRIIRYMYFDIQSKQFYFLLCKDYDKHLHVATSHRQNMEIRFAKSIEPGILSIFDVHVCELPGSTDAKKKMQIKLLSLNDEEFQLDEVTYDDTVQEGYGAEWDKPIMANGADQQNRPQSSIQEHIEYFDYSYTPIRAFSTNWPYVAFSGLQNSIMLFNAFDRKYLRQIEIAPPEEEIRVCESCFTEGLGLFVVVQKRDKYIVYMIDLDESNIKEFHGKSYALRNRYKLQTVFEYTQEDVDDEQLVQFHARGSSRKEKQDANKKVVLFFRHGDDLYSHVQSKDEFRPNQKLVKVDKIASNLKQRSGAQLLYLQNTYDDDKKLVSQEIKQITIKFSDYRIRTVYKELSQGEVIQGFNIDQATNKIIMQSKQYILSSAGQQKICKLRIYDLEKGRIYYDSVIEHPPLIGRLKSDLYAFVDGHIYYNNNVIKLRYDLIDQPSNQVYKENEILDYYFDIFHLPETARVKADTPLDSLLTNRFCYIIVDKTKKRPNTVLLLPYLHDRKIFLTRIKDHTEYFYTSIETYQYDEDQYHEHLIKVLKLDRSILQQVESPRSSKNLTDMSIAAGTRDNIPNVLKRDDSPRTPRNPSDTFTSIVCVNITEKKFYVYSQAGFLINRVDFSHLEEEYGDPVSVSNNGRLLIFKKNWESLDRLKKQGEFTEQQLRNEFMTVYLMHLSVFGMVFLKKINMLQSIRQFVEMQNNQKELDVERFIFEENTWALDQPYREMSENIQFKFIINDNADICIRMRNQEDIDDEELDDIRTIYYYEDTSRNLPEDVLEGQGFVESDLASLVEANLEEQDSGGEDFGVKSQNEFRKVDFQMNKNSLFFWDLNNVYQFKLSEGFSNSNIKQLPLSLDPSDHESYIKEVRTGSNPDIIVVLVNQSRDVDSVVVWDLEQDVEAETTDIEESYQILWDQFGKPYILSNGKVRFTDLRCATKAFDINEKDMNSFFGNPDSDIQHHKGHRVDAKNHNWVIFQKYLKLPFSYMTFVIKEKIEAQDELQEGNVFDPDPYNYIFNKSTPFIDGDFTHQDHHKLEDVLEKFESIDPDLLELLHYTQEIIVANDDNEDDEEQTRKFSALHKAYEQGNNRSVDIILGFMTKIKQNSSRNFGDLLYKLIDHSSFKNYISDLPVQTLQMRSKVLLKIREPLNSQMVSMRRASFAYLDDKYYADEMDEDKANPEYSSYPVSVVALRIGWMVNEDYGKKLLQAIVASGDLELYDISTVQMITEFLYQKFKWVICCSMLPIFVGAHIFFAAQVQENADYNKELLRSLQEGGETAAVRAFVAPFSDSATRKGLNSFMTGNLVMLLLQMIQMGIVLNYMGSSYFRRFYTYIDLGYVLSDLALTALLFYKFNAKLGYEEFKTQVVIERYVECLGLLFLWQKLTYFLSLIDQIAPLIDMIFKIAGDIKWFVLVSLIYVYTFAALLPILARNQVDFEEADRYSIPYRSLGGALHYVLAICYGGADPVAFDLGTAESRAVLYLVFYLAVFWLLIHFLNMVIAIMGNSFSERSGVAGAIMTRNHLSFVVDNWSLMSIAVKERDELKYIITAFFAQPDTQGTSMLRELKGEISKLSATVRESFRGVHHDNRDMCLLGTHIMKHLKAFTKPRQPKAAATRVKAKQ